MNIPSEIIEELKSQRKIILEVNSNYAESLKKMKIGGWLLLKFLLWMENADLARFKLQNMTKLEDLHENDNTVELNKVEENISNNSNDLLAELENLLN